MNSQKSLDLDQHRSLSRRCSEVLSNLVDSDSQSTDLNITKSTIPKRSMTASKIKRTNPVLKTTQYAKTTENSGFQITKKLPYYMTKENMFSGGNMYYQHNYVMKITKCTKLKEYNVILSDILVNKINC